jgi:proline iminopeptidase
LSARAEDRTSDRRVLVSPGVELLVHEEGHGTPLIALHGGPGLDHYSIAPDLVPLTAKHRVIYYDQRGSGGSTLVAEATAADMVADLESLRQALSLDRVPLLGHSWGGGLAALYALAHPDRVSRLVLVDPMPLRGSELPMIPTRLHANLSAEDNVRLAVASQQQDRATTDAERVAACRTYWSILIKAYYGNPARARRGRGDTCAASAAALTNGNRVNERLLTALGDYDWRRDVAAIMVPTLIVHGERDPIPLDGSREWNTAIPGSRLLVVPGSGHMPFVEAPTLFFRAVEDFLGGH